MAGTADASMTKIISRELVAVLLHQESRARVQRYETEHAGWGGQNGRQFGKGAVQTKVWRRTRRAERQKHLAVIM